MIRFRRFEWFGLLSPLLSLAIGLAVPQIAQAQVGPAEGKEGLVDLGGQDPRLKGHYAPKGFRVQIVASEPQIIDPTGMAFDDDGNLYVAEWRVADHMYDTDEILKLPEGGTTKVKRRRKATTDIVKRLRDNDGDGVYESSQIVVDGAEMPSSIFPWKNSLYLTCTGRLERWSDDDGNGTFETKMVIADGFCGFYHHWLSGMTLASDGWFYLTAGDNDNHVIGSDGSRVEVSRCGAIFRGKVDGSQMNLFSMGFRNPYRDLAFNTTFDAFHVDNDQEDGSKFQGVRLINCVEEGDYGWRLLPGAPCCAADFDRGAVSGEAPGKLPIVAKTGRGAPAGLTFYYGSAFPEAYRGLAYYPDVFRKSVRAYKLKPQGGGHVLDSEMTLMTADDDLFRPCHMTIGPDGAIYVLDWRSNSGGAGRLWGDGKWGRLYKLTWQGDSTGLSPIKANNWRRIKQADAAGLLAMMKSSDLHEARRAQREFVERGESHREPLIALMNDSSASLHARLLGLQGSRQFWSERVAKVMIDALNDPAPEIRRLAAQSLSWEPKAALPIDTLLIAKIAKETDGRVLRELALALGTHGKPAPYVAAPALADWLFRNRKADVFTRDAFIRALERLGEPGAQELARDIEGADAERRAWAVADFAAMRTAPAARLLSRLATAPRLSDAERLALVRMHKDIPLNVPMPTQPLADWVAKHPETSPEVKIATLDVCLLGGYPANDLALKLLDDPNEGVRLAATRLAARTQPPGAFDRLSARLAEPSRSLTERLGMVQALRSAGPQAFQAVKAAYDRFADQPEFRIAALRCLADSDRNAVIPIAQAALKNGSAELKAQALQVLGETPQAALGLGEAFLKNELPASDLPAVLSALRKFNSPDHQKTLRSIEQQVERSLAAISIDDLKARVKTQGDPWKGLQIYLRDAGSSCFSCHKLESFGGNVGPALTDVHKALSIEKLIESILVPSKEIKEGFESYKVVLKDGRVLSGIRVSQDDKVMTLKDAKGQESRIERSEIEEQVKDSASIMPLGLVADLSPDELANLIAFLAHPQAQATLRYREPIRAFVGIGPFEAQDGKESIPLDQIRLKQTFPGQNNQTVAWERMDVSSRFTVNMKGQLGINNARAYLATRIQVPEAQDATLRLGAGSASRLYLNGSKLADLPAGPVASSSAQARLPLRKGWNTLILSIDRVPVGDGNAIFELNTASPAIVEPFSAD